MNCNKFKYYVNDFIDEQLTPELKEGLEKHLFECSNCRTLYNNTLKVIEEARSLPEEIMPPENLWDKISDKISPENQHGHKEPIVYPINIQGTLEEKYGRALRFILPYNQTGRKLTYYGAAALLLIGFMIGFFYYTKSSAAFWPVEIVEESSVNGSELSRQHAMLKRGEWLETGENTRARLTVGMIGEVVVEKNSRLKLMETGEAEHRMSLEKGTIHATIFAPPRLFFVETPSAVAVDLGCVYTLEVDDSGSGFLEVVSGWVALEHDGIESMIPAGAVCRTKINAGPGTPYFNDASENFKRALSEFDFIYTDIDLLNIITTNSRKKDALTLWHLLLRVPDENRGIVYDKLASLSPPPAGVTRTEVLRGDLNMIFEWWDTLGYGNRMLWGM